MDQRITIIVTMAGLGERFRKAGYNCPKYMIEAKGRSLFEWSMDSLKDYFPYADQTIFIVRAEDNAREFIGSHCANLGIFPIQIIELDHCTDGQATTAMLAMPYCRQELPVMIYNIDTYVEPYAMQFSAIAGDGHIPCFHAEGDHWSFVRLNEQGQVVEVKEKVRISDLCSLGAYYFSSAELYEQLYKEFYEGQNRSEQKEKFIAPMYNFMLEKGMNVTVSVVDQSCVHVLGTPEELEHFLSEKQV